MTHNSSGYSRVRTRTQMPSAMPRRRWPRRVLITVNVVAALMLIGAATAYGYVQWRLGQIRKERIAALTGVNGGKPFTILIVGSDSRSALAANDPANAQFGSASQTPGQRSDTIILARVAPASRQIELMSVPRDLWVNIPGQGMNRINSAFDSGPNLLVQTIQTDLGIPVNHYIEVNFDSFQQIADAVGGVNFYFPTPAKDAYSLLNVSQAGCVNLTGAQALGFVRSRHYEYYQNGEWHFEAASDLARVQRQQTFIKKMIKKAENKFTDPIALNNVIGAVTKNLTVDSGFSNSMLLNLAQDFRSVDASGIPSITLPNYSFTTSGGADVLGLQQPQAAQTIAGFNSFGNPPPPAAHPSQSSAAAPKTVSTMPSVTVPAATVTVEVANGTGVPGQASQLVSLLQAKGYQTNTNTAPHGTGTSITQVLYAPDSLTAAQQIAATIPGGATLQASPALGPSAYNVEVITGTSYTGAGGSSASSTGSSSSSSSSPSTTATTVPGTNPATYALPGMPAGATPPPC